MVLIGTAPEEWMEGRTRSRLVRRARREFGGDPDQARVRPPEVVENYEQ